MVLGARYSSRDMREYQIVPAMKGHQPVGRRQINARLPFFGRNLIANSGLFYRATHDFYLNSSEFYLLKRMHDFSCRARAAHHCAMNSTDMSIAQRFTGKKQRIVDW